MVRSAQEEKNYQLSLGIGFVAAAGAVMVALALRLSYCCEWFGSIWELDDQRRCH